jgi:hypothetical protein
MPAPFCGAGETQDGGARSTAGIVIESVPKMMATAHHRDGNLFVAVKGAPEQVLSSAVGVGSARSRRDARRGWFAGPGACRGVLEPILLLLCIALML